MTARSHKAVPIGDRELLSAIVEAAPTGMLLVDSNARIVMANQQIERTLGYVRAQLIGRPLDDLLPERSRQIHPDHIAQFRSNPHPRHLGAGRDLWARHQDGRDIPVEIGLAPVRYKRHLYVLASVIDITERRGAEERLRWLSLAVDQGPTSVVMTDLAGNIEYVNPKFTEVTGYTLDEVRGKNPRILKSGMTAPETYRDLWNAITAGRSWHGEILNRKKDGTSYWDAMWVYPIRDARGAVTRLLALKEDVTHRKDAEQALRASEQRLRTLLETVNLIVLGLDANANVEYVNPFFLKVAGYEREEVVGKSWFQFLPERLRLGIEGVFRELLTQDLHPHYENPILTRQGKERLIAWNNTVLRDPKGQPAGTLSIGEDITERTQLEAQFRQAQKMEAVGRLAGGVAHDFNNVLTAIFGYTELMLGDLPEDSPMREDLGEIRKASQPAATLTKQLLAFSRQQVLEPVVLSLNDLVQDIEKMVGRMVGEDVDVRLNLAADAGNVRADPGQLHQVIMNLAVNARDAMPTGGTLLLETGSADLTAEDAEAHRPMVPGRYVMLAVSDTGTGMDATTKAKIFEPFFTTKERGKGTGLGLSTVFGIVKQSGGYIWVYSEPGRGTTFKIYLPRVEEPVESAPTSRPMGTLAGTETIVFAEDDAMLRPLSKGMLEKLGYTVLAAEDARQALELVRHHSGEIHLLVSDVVMPGKSGLDLARELEAVRPGLRVLFMSGYTDEAVVRHGLLERGTNFLQKPFTPAALARKVREVLDNK
jgi:PAS domain S-box-containing protein